MVVIVALRLKQTYIALPHSPFLKRPMSIWDVYHRKGRHNKRMLLRIRNIHVIEPTEEKSPYIDIEVSAGAWYRIAATQVQRGLRLVTGQ